MLQLGEMAVSGSVLMVHGTGVRFADYRTSYDAACQVAGAAGVEAKFEECLWGDPCGIAFEGLSLPDPPDAAAAREAAAEDAFWGWRFDEPLLELEQLAQRPRGGAIGSVFDQSWRTSLAEVTHYRASHDLLALLRREQLEADWALAWAELCGAPILQQAFQQSHAAGELPDCKKAVARAAIAMLHNQAVASGRSGPSAALRNQLAERLSTDFGEVFGVGTWLARQLARAATVVARRKRNPINHAIAAALGDILLYQSRGGAIREFIAQKIAALPDPVTVVAHSLGGIACVDLLATRNPPLVARLVTVGSQSPYFYEIGALTACKRPERLPASFPPWLNLYDRNDLLSFVGARLFGDQVADREVRSGQPFPMSHSAYFTSAEVWAAIRTFREA